jgi:Flp pilus assembly protein TadG
MYSCFLDIRCKIARFRSSDKGAVAVLFALGLVPTTMMVGAAVDYSGATNAKTLMQQAADASALTAASLGSSTPTERRNRANAIFRANMAAMPELAGVTGSLTEHPGNIYRYTVNAQFSTNFVRIAGFDSVGLQVKSDATTGGSGGQPLEFVIAHDITNSMFFDPAQFSRAVAAMQGFVTRVFAGSQNGTVVGSVQPYSDRVRLRPNANAWATGGQPGGWQGCLAPREQVVAGRPNTLTDDPPSLVPFAYHVNVTKTAPGGYSYTFGCYGAQITAAEESATPLIDALQQMGQGGTGRLDEGMAWSFRLLSPRWRNRWNNGQYPRDYNAARKIAILVTDGRTEAYRYEVLPPSGVANVYGGNMGSQLGFENLEHVCTQMKTAGIEVVVVQLDGNSSFTAHARRCASSGQHYMITNIAQFETVFSQIGGGQQTVARIVK